MELLAFNMFAAVAVACSLFMIVSKKPVNSAMNLIAVMFALAGLFAMQEAHLIAALQVLVYAGAIMVLFLFVIMMLNLREKVGMETRRQPFAQLLAVIVLGGLFTPMVALYDPSAVKVKIINQTFGSTAGVGRLLFTDYLLPFEIASVLLLAALVGAVVLTKTRLR
ncbi:MAG: NADH-quinone oxidoreductase subunit J [Nitrospinae bacterium]|nr:NADH-quinone oxidoreductase subunit J [Nitrospinota bacterium]